MAQESLVRAWDVVDEQVSRSRIPRVPYKDILGVTLTDKITELRISGLTKEGTHKAVMNLLKPYILPEAFNELSRKVFISVCARYGEQRSFENRRSKT